MRIEKLKFYNWEFEVHKDFTKGIYKKIEMSAADSCTCVDCKNYVVYRDNVFPKRCFKLI